MVAVARTGRQCHSGQNRNSVPARGLLDSAVNSTPSTRARARKRSRTSASGDALGTRDFHTPAMDQLAELVLNDVRVGCAGLPANSRSRSNADRVRGLPLRKAGQWQLTLTVLKIFMVCMGNPLSRGGWFYPGSPRDEPACGAFRVLDNSCGAPNQTTPCLSEISLIVRPS